MDAYSTPFEVVKKKCTCKKIILKYYFRELVRYWKKIKIKYDNFYNLTMLCVLHNIIDKELPLIFILLFIIF